MGVRPPAPHHAQMCEQRGGDFVKMCPFIKCYVITSNTISMHAVSTVISATK